MNRRTRHKFMRGCSYLQVYWNCVEDDCPQHLNGYRFVCLSISPRVLANETFTNEDELSEQGWKR